MLKAFYFMLSLFFVSAHSQEQYTIYFDVDKDVATASSAEKFQHWVENNRNCTVTKIIGYADSTGTSAYNLPLSKRRANYTFEQLKAHNIIISGDAEITGLGETKVFSENLSSDRIAIIYYTPAEDPKPKSKLNAAVKNARIGDKLKLESKFLRGLRHTSS